MFWLKFVLIALVVFALISFVKFILRKTLMIEKVKKEFFSNNYINELHRQVDKWVGRLTGLILPILILVLINNEALHYLLIVGLISTSLLDYGVKAFFEYRYSEAPKQAILTVTEWLLVMTAVVVVLQLGVLGSF
ncbi:DUF4181 domain-containing protein [Rossellomorea vietnamensis]|uniref:DUF4181 domain-containing protein n=1 Tax=Rossellomorea vietnamensis TaxID=218284 RepID=A0A6I6UCJ2_9BACI|nr:DUF4181 domain-containing protein [Rossellomorea vietnamensis]QHE60434.1 DUF4181 domain-containing protein [Rossellomorea vietnamensis]